MYLLFPGSSRFLSIFRSHQCRVSSPFSAQRIPDPINVKCCSCKLQLPIRTYECVTLLNSRAILLEVELKQKHQKRGMLKVSCPPPSIAVLWANITLRRVHATWLHCWLVPALCGGDCACSFPSLSMFKSRGNRIPCDPARYITRSKVLGWSMGILSDLWRTSLLSALAWTGPQALCEAEAVFLGIFFSCNLEL